PNPVARCRKSRGHLARAWPESLGAAQQRSERRLATLWGGRTLFGGIESADGSSDRENEPPRRVRRLSHRGGPNSQGRPPLRECAPARWTSPRSAYDIRRRSTGKWIHQGVGDRSGESLL